MLRHGARQKIEHLIHAFATPRADQRHGRAQFRCQFLQIHAAAAAAQVVGHVEDHQRGQAQRQDGRGQHQVARHVSGIEHQQHGFRLGGVGALAGQNVVRHLLVLRTGRKTVHSREVDQLDGAAIG